MDLKRYFLLVGYSTKSFPWQGLFPSLITKNGCQPELLVMLNSICTTCFEMIQKGRPLELLETCTCNIFCTSKSLPQKKEILSPKLQIPCRFKYYVSFLKTPRPVFCDQTRLGIVAKTSSWSRQMDPQVWSLITRVVSDRGHRVLQLRVIRSDSVLFVHANWSTGSDTRL